MPLPEGTENQSAETPDFDAMDQAQFEAYRRGETVETEASEAPGDKPEAPEPDPDSDPEEDQDAADEDKPKSDRGWQRKVDKLTKKLRTLEAEKATGPQGVASPQSEAASTGDAAATDDPEPDANKFDDYEKYALEKARWQIRQEDKAKAKVEAENKAKADAARMVEDYSARVKKLTKDPAYADFGEKVGAIAKQLPPVFAEAIMTDENGPQIAYAIATDQKLAEKLQGMTLPQAIREIGKISVRFDKAPEKPQSPVSKAPAPVKPVSAAKSAPVSRSIYDEDLSQDEYEKLRREQQKRRN